MDAIEFHHSHPEKPNKRTSFFVSFILSPSLELRCSAETAYGLSYFDFFSFLFLVGENFHFYFRCGSMSNCSVPVSSAVFEDPCPGTHKYVEVHYKCMLGWSSIMINQLMRSVSCRHVPLVSMQS
jgi:hypothetical protein